MKIRIDICPSDLWGVDLTTADLENATGYCESHDVFREAVRRAGPLGISDEDYAMIAKILVNRWSWSEIHRNLYDAIIPVYERLAEYGYTEWADYYKNSYFASRYAEDDNG